MARDEVVLVAVVPELGRATTGVVHALGVELSEVGEGVCEQRLSGSQIKARHLTLDFAVVSDSTTVPAFLVVSGPEGKEVESESRSSRR